MWDALRMKNTIQIIGLCAANVAILVYTAIQIDQIQNAVAILSGAGASRCARRDGPVDHHQALPGGYPHHPRRSYALHVLHRLEAVPGVRLGHPQADRRRLPHEEALPALPGLSLSRPPNSRSASFWYSNGAS